MKALLVLSTFIVITTVNSQSTTEATTTPPVASTTPSTPQCAAPGIYCHQCSKVVYCTSSSSEPTLVQPCARGEICDENRLQCVKPPSQPTCSPTDHLPFTCLVTGIFPNPGNCKKYHFCVEDEEGNILEFPAECSNGYGYNPKTTFCDKTLKNNKCSGYPVPLCTGYGGTGPVKENPTLYYTCVPHPEDPLVAYPVLSACPNGMIYSASSGCK